MDTTTVTAPYGSAPATLYAADVATTELMGIEETRKVLGDRITAAEKTETHTIVTKHGQPAAALVDIAWYTRARESLGDPTDIRVVPPKPPKGDAE